MWRVMERMAPARPSKSEIDLLLDMTSQVEGHTICALGRRGRLADPGPASATSAARSRSASTGYRGRKPHAGSATSAAE